MSQAESQAPEPNRTVTKKVDVVAYLKDQTFDGWREWADYYDDTRDYFERRERERNNYVLKGFGLDIDITKDQWEVLKNQNLGRLSPVNQKEVEVKYSNRPREFVRDIKDGICEALPDKVADFKRKSTYWNYKWEDSDSDAYYNITSNTDRLPMLKHPSEITVDDMFEGDEALFAMKFKVKARNVTEEDLEELEEELTQPFITMIGRNELVDKVRVYECEQESKEEGVCFNI